MRTRADVSPLRKHAPLLERVRIPQAAFSILFFLLVNLDSTLLPGSVDASPWVLVDYTFCLLVTLDGIEDKASGAAFDVERDLLWVITNEPARLFGYDRTGALQQTVDVLGIRDPEGVTWTGGSELAIMEEGAGGALALVDVPPDTTEVLVQIRRPVGTAVEDNAGPEGVAFDPRDEGFFFVNEREPQRVMKLFSNGTMNDVFDPRELQLADLSGVYFSQVPQPSLFILSQTDRKLVHVDLEGNVLGSRLVHGNRPEGVAFTPDGEVMYIVSEPNQLALFSTDMDCQAAAQAQPAPAVSAG